MQPVGGASGGECATVELTPSSAVLRRLCAGEGARVEEHLDLCDPVVAEPEPFSDRRSDRRCVEAHLVDLEHVFSLGEDNAALRSRHARRDMLKPLQIIIRSVERRKRSLEGEVVVQESAHSRSVSPRQRGEIPIDEISGSGFVHGVCLLIRHTPRGPFLATGSVSKAEWKLQRADVLPLWDDLRFIMSERTPALRRLYPRRGHCSSERLSGRWRGVWAVVQERKRRDRLGHDEDAGQAK
jgi:hypothetical protein